MIGSALDSLESISNKIKNGSVIQLPRVDGTIGTISGDVLSDTTLLAQKLSINLSTDSQPLSPNQNGATVIFENEMNHLLDFYKDVLYAQQHVFLFILVFGLIGILIAISVVLWDALLCKKYE